MDQYWQHYQIEFVMNLSISGSNVIGSTSQRKFIIQIYEYNNFNHG